MDYDRELTEFYEGLDYFDKTDREKANGDITLYYTRFLEHWSYCCMESLGDLYDKVLKQAIKTSNYEQMYACMYSYRKSQMLWTLASGCDHCYIAWNTLLFLLCSRFDDIYIGLPKGLPLSSNGHPTSCNMTNLLLCILYGDAYDVDKVITKAQAFLGTKKPKWDLALVASLLGILTRDTKLISDNLQIMCETNSKAGFSKWQKQLCMFAYGVLIVAEHYLTEEEFNSIRLPEYKNFDQGYLAWILKGDGTGEALFSYRKPYDFLNEVIKLPLPETKVHKEDRKLYVDCDAMNEDVLQRVLAL